MRKVFFLITVLSMHAGLSGQSNQFEGRMVTEDEVPEEVLASHEDNFAGKKVVRWRFQRSTGANGTTLERYVVTMKEGKRPLSNARYTPDGELIFYAEYYGSKTIPGKLMPDLKENFPAHRITGGTHIKLYKTKKEYYRIRLKKGSTVTYVFYDKDGNQVDRNQLPADADFG
ncbi:MAG: hypothetical protein AAGF96_20685 [Bacteroidota bacterium]